MPASVSTTPQPDQSRLRYSSRPSRKWAWCPSTEAMNWKSSKSNPGPTSQPIRLQASRRLPVAGAHRGHGLVAAGWRGQHAARQFAGGRTVHQELERRAIVEVPHFVGCHHVPAAELRRFQQIVDRRQRCARTARRLDDFGRAMRFAIPATLGVRHELQLRDQLLGGVHRRGGFGAVTRSQVPEYCAPSHTVTP